MNSKSNKPEVPQPADPGERKQPLPWHSPKPFDEDPEGPGKLQAILNSPSYVPAVEDVDYLTSEGSRGVRLQLDYQKPEILLRKEGVQHAIVVFGSTRLVEPAAAQRKLDNVRSQLASAPDNAELKQRLAVAERVCAKSHYYDIACAFSRLVAQFGGGPRDPRLLIMTGGGPGIMEAANRGAHDAGSKTVGLNITLPHEQFPNPYVTPGLCFQFHYFSMRKMHFVLRAKALVAFPGGFGTFDEVFETLTLIQTRKIKPIPVVLVGEAFWRKAFDIDFLAAEGVIDAEDRDLFWFAETAEDIWTGIQNWYASTGETLIQGN